MTHVVPVDVMAHADWYPLPDWKEGDRVSYENVLYQAEENSNPLNVYLRPSNPNEPGLQPRPRIIYCLGVPNFFVYRKTT